MLGAALARIVEKTVATYGTSFTFSRTGRTADVTVVGLIGHMGAESGGSARFESDGVNTNEPRPHVVKLPAGTDVRTKDTIEHDGWLWRVLTVEEPTMQESNLSCLVVITREAKL